MVSRDHFIEQHYFLQNLTLKGTGCDPEEPCKEIPQCFVKSLSKNPQLYSFADFGEGLQFQLEICYRESEETSPKYQEMLKAL